MAMDDDGDPLLLGHFQNAVGLPKVGIDMGDIITIFLIDGRLHPRILAGLELMGHCSPDARMLNGVGVLEID